MNTGPIAAVLGAKVIGQVDVLPGFSGVDKLVNDIAELKKNQEITIEDVMKLDIRIGTILEATNHPKLDKILVLKVDVGNNDHRTICAGVRQYYSLESLAGKQIAVIVNLKPRDMRGIISQGMLLAASNPDKTNLALVTVDKAVFAGDKVS